MLGTGDAPSYFWVGRDRQSGKELRFRTSAHVPAGVSAADYFLAFAERYYRHLEFVEARPWDENGEDAHRLLVPVPLRFVAFSPPKSSEPLPEQRRQSVLIRRPLIRKPLLKGA